VAVAVLIGATVAGHSRSSHHPGFVPAGEAAGRGPARGAVLVPPPPAPDVAFGDTVTLVCLGYTHCPNVCPVILGDTAAALRPAPAALRRRVQVVFVRL